MNQASSFTDARDAEPDPSPDDQPTLLNQPGSKRARPLRDSVAEALSQYFAELDGQMVSDVYDMVLVEMEEPLLRAVLDYTRNNQSKAAEVLGLNRGTLRKKLKRYNLL